MRPDDLLDVPPYNTSDETLRSLEVWKHGDLRPDLFVVAPSIRDVGENELIRELAQASYELQGFCDSKRRHFIARSFVRGGSEARYAQFVDEPFDASEITDGFYGVDVIDLTEWVGTTPANDMGDWRRLVDYVTDHPETDFVFLAYADDPKAIDPLVRAIRESCAIAVEVVELAHPTKEALARSFLGSCNGEYDEKVERILQGMDQLLARGSHPNHSFVKSCALSSLHELAIDGNAGEALDKTFARFEELTPLPARTHFIGF